MSKHLEIDIFLETEKQSSSLGFALKRGESELNGTLTPVTRLSSVITEQNLDKWRQLVHYQALRSSQSSPIVRARTVK